LLKALAMEPAMIAAATFSLSKEELLAPFATSFTTTLSMGSVCAVPVAWSVDKMAALPRATWKLLLVIGERIRRQQSCTSVL